MGYLILSIVCLILFSGLTSAVVTGIAEPWDRRIMLAIASGRQPWLTGWMKLLSVAGAGLVEIPLALLLILGLAMRKRSREAWWYTAAALSGWALYALAKLAVQRP